MLQQDRASLDVDLNSPPSRAPLVYLDWRNRLDREIERHFPSEVLASFTPLQLAVFEHLRSRAPTKHAFEYRISIPTPWKSYYLSVFAGPERRSAERLAHERQTSLLRQSTLLGGMLFVLLSSAMFGVMCAVYLVESAFGIDLIEGPSQIHAVYQLFLQQ